MSIGRNYYGVKSALPLNQKWWVLNLNYYIIKCYKESETDTSNFDPAFTDGIPVDSLPNYDAPLSATLQENFKGFTYTDDNPHMTSVSMTNTSYIGGPSSFQAGRLRM